MVVAGDAGCEIWGHVTEALEDGGAHRVGGGVVREVAAEDEEERLRRRRGDELPEVGEDAADALDGDDADGDGVVLEQRVEGIKLLLQQGVEVAEGEGGVLQRERLDEEGRRVAPDVGVRHLERPPQDGLVPERGRNGG